MKPEPIYSAHNIFFFFFSFSLFLLSLLSLLNFEAVASLFLLGEAESLVHAIHEFQRYTSNKKASRIDSTLHKLVERIAITNSLNSRLLDASKRKTRAAASAFSCFYDPSWLTDIDKFPIAVARFEEIITNFQIMDSSLQQSITSAVTSAVATAATAV